MFYSQFILAKKGPLGTIWIAAHLERKLRKNQVADTDIGVSVDSILFPEVPIALRLSSHLLLGVVRIYSRKVNYLFDDCSEALLKIKQAFRSTAVDLPPEESTAPYHSITLPETFDLDDFELPDNDIFQGNYVDHHISTRDQITLQDTMEGVVYSTSQFGLDERFGDGETSQVGLDLEEDLFLDKVAATVHNKVYKNDAQMSVEMMPHPKTHASYERMTGSSEEMPLNGTRNKVGLAANFEVIDYAHAPSTPGLLEEPNVTSVKEVPACDDHLESEEHNLRELVGRRLDNIPSESDLNHRGDASVLSLGGNLNHDTLVSTPAEEYSCLSAALENNQAEPGEFLFTSVTTEHIPADESGGTMDGLDKVEDKNNFDSCGNEQSMPSIDRINGENEELGIRSQETDNVEIACNLEKSHSIDSAAVLTAVQSLVLSSAQESVNDEGQDLQGLVDPESNDHNNNGQRTPTSSGFLQACNFHLSLPDESSLNNKSVVNLDLQSVDVEPLSADTLQREEELDASGTSTKVQGEECHMSDGVQSEENRISELTLNGEIQEDGGKQAEQLDNVISKDNQCENLNGSMTCYLPAPEKLLSAPQRFLDEPHDFLVQTPDMEVQEEGDGINISGKKRTFAESSITMLSLNTVESFGATRSKGTVDSVPDDDDLLSSILVGRRSSVLKMKPTPPAPEVPPTKRARSASRPSALKRKVLLDDSMVLHGDAIRQQLINTEDIRRLRKKAACTLTEILMIQRQFLVGEIFGEPLLTGMSAELTHVHNEAFDLSRIRVTENDDNNHASFGEMNDENSAKNNVTQGGEIEGSTDTYTCRNDADGYSSEFPVQKGNEQVEDHLGSYDIDCQEHRRNDIAEEMDLRSSVHDHLGEIGEMEIDKANSEVADATNNTILGVETVQSEPVYGDTSEMPTSTVDQSAIAHDFMQMDTPNLPSDKIDTQLIEEVPFLKDMSNGIGLDGIEAVDHFAEKIVSVGTELRTKEEILLEESKINASFEVRTDGQADGSAPNDDVDASLANMSSDNCGCINFNSINVDRGLEEIENDKHGVFNEDGGMAMSSGCIDDKDLTCNHLCDEDSKMESTYLVGLDGDLKNASVSGEDCTICQHANYHHSMDTQNAPVDHVTAGDFDDIQDVAFANDTEFLNVDDDEIGGDDDEGMPNAEDTRLLDNSGWSSRTRAVAKYLQTLFDEEAGHGRKILSLDNLLAGKTCKEASRMFFETLVLKTRDYVHVEQARPFDSINIKPRAKLMKSEF